MKTALMIPSLLFVLLLGCTQQPNQQSSRLQTRLDSLINHEHEANRFDGTLVIGTQESVLYQQAIGTANRVWHIPMQLKHRFDICSINKSFIAALIMMAVEEGKLSLDDSLVNLLDGFQYAGNFDPAITIHHMLSHTSGLPDYRAALPPHSEMNENTFRLFKRKHFTNSEHIDFISQLPTRGEVNAQFYYSNFAYHLLCILLEAVYNQPFDELLTRKICHPLGLKHTFSTVSTTEVFEHLVEAYNYVPETEDWQRNHFIAFTLGRRIFSTAYDLYLWARAMNDTSLLNHTSLSNMQTNHVGTIHEQISYGYGWVIFDGAKQYRMGNLEINEPYIIHGGSTEGYKSMLINIDKGKFIISFLANTGAQTNEIVLAKKITHILLEELGDEVN